MLVQTYFAYLAISIALTIWVARTLFKHGRVFLVDVFAGNEAIADSVNHLLVVGFYLINLGFIAFFLKAGDPVNSAQVAVEFLSTKIGVVVLVLGGMHFINLGVFAKVRGQQLARQEAQEWKKRQTIPPVTATPFTGL